MKFPVSKQVAVMFSIEFGILAILFVGLIGLWILIPYGRIEISLIIILCVLAILILRHGRRVAYSTLLINEQGVTNQCRGYPDIFIPWSECEDIFVCKLNMGYGLEYNRLLCFSRTFWGDKNKLPDKIILRPNEQCLKIDYSEAVLEKVLEYIDKSRIRGLNML